MIRFDHVTKTYKKTIIALDDVSVDIGKGEFVFLVGASGSGKSTFIKLLLKDVEPDGGEIVVAGKRLPRMRPWKVPALRRELGCVFQDFKLLENKTVYENVAFAQEVIGTPPGKIRIDVPDALEVVGLSHKKDAMPHELSGGEQQRVSIARAIVNRPRIMLCDEPTGNLDEQAGDRVASVLFDLHARQHTILVIVTHNAGLAARCAIRFGLSNQRLERR